jgi:hypothetical protein
MVHGVTARNKAQFDYRYKSRVTLLVALSVMFGCSIRRPQISKMQLSQQNGPKTAAAKIDI